MNFLYWTPQPWWPHPFPPIAGGDITEVAHLNPHTAPDSPSTALTEGGAVTVGEAADALTEGGAVTAQPTIQTFNPGDTIQVSAGVADPYGKIKSFPRLFTFPDPSAQPRVSTADEINELAISLMISAARQGLSLDFPTATGRAEDLLGLAARQSTGGGLTADQSARLDLGREELASLDQFRESQLAETSRSNTIALLTQTQNYATEVARLSQNQGQFDSNLGLLQDRLDLDRAQGNATLALQTRAQIERENARLADNVLQRQELNAQIQQFRQGLNAQVQTGNADRSLVAAESALARATTLLGLQSGDEQFRLREERALLSDIANMAVNAGDVGRQAAFLEAGSTGISQALAGGETGFTGESLRPLNESLGLLDRLRQQSGSLQGGLADVITQPSAVERVETIDPSAGQVPLLQTNAGQVVPSAGAAVADPAVADPAVEDPAVEDPAVEDPAVVPPPNVNNAPAPGETNQFGVTNNGDGTFSLANGAVIDNTGNVLSYPSNALTDAGKVVSDPIQALLDAAPEFAVGSDKTEVSPPPPPPPPTEPVAEPVVGYTGPGLPRLAEGGTTSSLMAIIGDPQEDGTPNPELVIGNPHGPGFQVIPLKDLPQMADGGFVGFDPNPGSDDRGLLTQLLGNDGSNRATNFLGSALQQALRRQNMKQVRTPVQGATPGRSAFLNERDAGLAALLGIQPRLFEEERRKALPTGISEGIVRRTA